MTLLGTAAFGSHDPGVVAVGTPPVRLADAVLEVVQGDGRIVFCEKNLSLAFWSSSLFSGLNISIVSEVCV